MNPKDKSSLSAELCEQGMREQIEILWSYQKANTKLDPRFVRTHALMLVQLTDEMRANLN